MYCRRMNFVYMRVLYDDSQHNWVWCSAIKTVPSICIASILSPVYNSFREEKQWLHMVVAYDSIARRGTHKVEFYKYIARYPWYCARDTQTHRTTFRSLVLFLHVSHLLWCDIARLTQRIAYESFIQSNLLLSIRMESFKFQMQPSLDGEQR